MLTHLNSLTTLQCSGIKTADFLQGQLTCDIRTLAKHGDSSLAACCDHRGRMIANFWVIHWHDDFLLLLPKSVSLVLCEHLKKYAVFSDVIITPIDHFFIAECTNEIKKNDNQVAIPLPQQNRQLMIVSQNPFPDMHITEDETEWRKNNIRDQLAILCDKTSLLFTPQMINLEKLGGVSFNKGCYVGQEIVARTHYLGTLKRHLKQFTLSSAHTLTAGDPVKNNQAVVIGVIVEAVLASDDRYDVLAVMQDGYRK